jgi:hypothetical protein
MGMENSFRRPGMDNRITPLRRYSGENGYTAIDRFKSSKTGILFGGLNP